MRILKIKTDKMLLGAFGEKVATKFLKKQGYKIRQKNYEAAGHEIDIIAENKEYIAFVEVKTRTVGRGNKNEPRPASAVTSEKQRSIITAAKCYAKFDESGRKKRLDIIEVYVSEENGKRRVAEIKHLIGAFNINTAYSR